MSTKKVHRLSDEDLIAKVYGRLTVVCRLSPERQGNKTRTRVLCLCSCGNRKEVLLDRLRQGRTQSCGCIQREIRIERNKRTAKFSCFSAVHPKTHAAWASMMERCYQNKTKSFPSYGGAGIVVCSYLQKTPQHLADLIGYHSGKLTLDRFPIHNGNYTCGTCSDCQQNNWSKNVRWATRTEQSLNRGKFNVRLTAFGMTKSASEWARLSGINAETIRDRKRRGWNDERCVATPDPQGNCFRSSYQVINV